MASEIILKQKAEEVKVLAENYQTLIDAIIKAKPAAAKGQYIKSVALTTTMGPSVYVNQK